MSKTLLIWNLVALVANFLWLGFSMAHARHLWKRTNAIEAQLEALLADLDDATPAGKAAGVEEL